MTFRFIDDPNSLSAALGSIRGDVAVDTEFHAEHRYLPKLMLIQLHSEGSGTLVLDALQLGDLAPIGRALAGRRLILHAATQDVRLLRARTGLAPAEVVDTQVQAGFAGLGFPRSLGELLEAALGLREDKALGLADWSRRPLPRDQLAYAAADVAHLHALAGALEVRLEPSARRDAALAAAELVDAAIAPVDPGTAWASIPAAAAVDPVGREVLRRLADWRERAARSQNMQPRQVISDAILVDIARRRPESVEALRRNRKLPKRVAQKYTDVVLRAVSDAQGVPAGALPASLRMAPERAAMDALLAAWAALVEARDGVAARLLMPDALRRELVARPPGAPIGDALGWRTDRFGDEIMALLAGELGISAGGARRLT